MAILTACGNSPEKQAMEEDLAAYMTFTSTVDGLDTSDFSAYAKDVQAAVDAFDCSSDEALALKADFQQLSDLLTSTADAVANEDYESDALTSYENQIEKITDQVKTDASSLATKAKELKVDDDLIKEAGLE